MIGTKTNTPPTPAITPSTTRLSTQVPPSPTAVSSATAQLVIGPVTTLSIQSR